MPDEQEIIAKFVADTSDFAQGAEEVVADSEAIQEATASMSQSMDDASGGFTALGDAASKAGAGVDEAASGFQAMGESTAGISKSTDEAATGIEDMGTASTKAAEGADEAAQSFQAVEESTGGIAKSTDEAASGIAETGTASSKAAGEMSLYEQAFGKAAESTAGVAKSADEASGGIAEVGTASSKAAESGATLEERIAAMQASFMAVTKGADEASSGIEEVGVVSSKGAEGADAVATSFTAVGKSADEMAGSIKQTGAEWEREVASADAAYASHGRIEESFQEVKEGASEVGKGVEEDAGAFDLLGGNAMMLHMVIMQLAMVAIQMVRSLAQAADAAQATATAFTYLTGNAEKAQQELSTLSNTWAAAKFGTQNIDNVAQHLLMSGEDAKTANEQINRVSDAVAAMGGSAQQIQPIIDKLISIQAESKVTTADMQQLVDQGLPAWQALAEGMGAVRGKLVTVAEAQREVSTGAISGKEAYADMMRGMMQYTDQARASSNSLGSEWTRLGENATQAFGPVIEALAKILDDINKIMEGSASLGDVLHMIIQASTFVVTGGGQIPGYASGGTDLPPGLRVIGEHGPEIQWSQGGDTVFPNGTNLMDFLGQVGGGSSGGGSSIPSLASMMNSGGAGGSSGMITVNITHLINLDGRTIASATIPYIAPMARTISGRRV